MHRPPLLLLFALPFIALQFARADNVKMTNPLGNMKVGGASLKDPAGVSHPHLDIAGSVAVVIFSIPDMSQGPSQRRWSSLLADKPESKIPDKVALVLVENMAAAGPFRDEARDDMKDQFTKKKRPFLLLDESGDIFKRFGIPRDKTEILIFDKTGTLRDVEENLGDKMATVNRIKTITAQLMGKRS